ncbi:MAG TPA: HAD family hydrolase [Candidatus Limnocylindrales bacterium]|nr:HAD family hydrolase [Candidatus Limnocylindrales bacterium]
MGERLAVAAITIDFGNTLVQVDRAGLRDVVEQTADAIGLRDIVGDRAAFLAAWAEERERQFREEVPEFREVDIGQRAVRVLARLRGAVPPAPEARWDDLDTASRVAPEEVDAVVGAYSAAFIEGMRPVPDATATLQRLAGDGFVLAILSNWPLAVTIDRFAAAHGWLPFLRAIVVSQRVGTIKPHPSIFRAAEADLGFVAAGDGFGAAEGATGAPRPPTDRVPILHVGDDWAADVVGAVRAGWYAAYLRDRQADTPLPTSEPGDGVAGDDDVAADLVLDELGDLADRVELDAAAAAWLAGATEPTGGPAAAPRANAATGARDG